MEVKVITNDDGSRETEKKHLRLIRLPKLNFKLKNNNSNSKYEVEVDRIRDDLEEKIMEVFNLMCSENQNQKDKCKPVDIVNGLKKVNFHIEHPDIMNVIDQFYLNCEKEGVDFVTFPKFMNYLNEKLSESTTWKECSSIFNEIKDENLFKNKSISEITPESLHNTFQSVGIEDLTLKDIEYIMNMIADNKDPNITLDEFYYLMTKRPVEYDAVCNVTRTFKNN